MKSIIIVSVFLLISFFDADGQWYVRKYNVTDINLLSKYQLDESLVKSKESLVNSGIAGTAGGLVMLIGLVILNNGLGEDPSLLEQILGPEIMGKGLFAVGTGVLAGSAVAGIVYGGRIGSIRSALIRNYAPAGSLAISPVLMMDSQTRSSCPGLSIIYKF